MESKEIYVKVRSDVMPRRSFGICLSLDIEQNWGFIFWDISKFVHQRKIEFCTQMLNS